MTRDDIVDAYELSPLQQGILVHELRQPGDRLYIVQVTAELDELDVAALSAAWNAVIARTPVLRTSIHWEAIDKPLQVVHRSVEVPLHVRTGLRDGELPELRLERAPLFVVEVESGRGRHVLRWTYHHIILDGWSAGLVLQDLWTAYRRVRGESSPPLRERRPFSEYVTWLQRQPSDRTEHFWRGMLAPVSGPTPIPARAGTGGADTGGRRTFPVHISADITNRLRVAATGAHVTMGTLLHAAWAVLLHRYSGDRTVVFGSTVSGRGADLDGIDEMIGLFINTLPVVLDIDPGLRLREWMGRVQDTLVSMREHEHASLVDIRRWSRVASGQPLFHSVLVFERFAPPGATTDVRISTAPAGDAGTELPLSICLAETPEGLVGSLTAALDRVEDAWAAAIPAHLGVLLDAVPDSLDLLLRELPVLTPAERRRLIVDFNDAVATADPPATIHGLFLCAAREHPDRLAVLHGDRHVTYGELARAALRLARRLRDSGIGPESRVGLCCRRTPEMIAAMYGILAAGAAYVPLDPAYPAERISFIAADANVSHMVTDSSADAIAPDGTVRIELEPVPGGDLGASIEAPRTPVAPGNLAYVLYTSGSTGRPKGVAIEHGSAAILLRWAKSTYTDGELDGVLASTSINFDCSIFEIFAPLSWGGYIVLATSSAQIPEVAPPHELRLASLVPSNLLAQLRNGTLPSSLRGVNLGGEASPRELLELLASHQRKLEVFHVYGPTEDTTYTTCARLRVTHGDDMPIGRPLPGTAVYLLDDQGRPAPPCCIGELYIGGSGLARSYLDRPDLTADRFVPDHVSGRIGARLYRTGDLGRFRPDGEIELIGRVDQQVKIRGYRIELGEIEVTLSRHPAVADAACIARTAQDGDRYLVAFVTPRPGETIDLHDLRRWLTARLPAPMIPARWVALDAMPRTPNGKIDRRALPETSSGEGAPRETTGSPPRDRLELELARIWEEILGTSGILRDDAFSEKGGHSLHAVSVLSRIRRTLGIRLPFAAMFAGASVASLAAEVRQLRTAPLTPLVTLASRGDRPPMYLVHPALGGVLCYGELARELSGIVPVLAFQAPGLDDDAAVLESVDAMAGVYGSEIARHMPEGPVTIGGWSFGALVAHEIACRLHQAGRSPRLLLIDPPPPPDGGASPSHQAMLDSFGEQLGLSSTNAVRGLDEIVHAARREGLLPSELEGDMVRRVFDVFTANLAAMAKHTPSRFDGIAVVIAAAERWQDSVDRIASAWKPLVGDLDLHEVPGNHLSMMGRPHVRDLASMLRRLTAEV